MTQQSLRQVARPLLLTSVVALLASIFFFFLGVPQLTKFLIVQETRLVNGSTAWRRWTNVTIPIFTKFYIFNVTNADDVVLNGAKFQVREVGPFVWEQKPFKKILSTNEEEDSITYQDVIYSYFRPDLSSGSIEDTVNIVNIPFIVASTLLYKQSWSYMANLAINYLANEKETFVLRNIRIRDLIADGTPLHPAYSIMADWENAISDMPSEIENGRFSFFKGKNGTPSESKTINRGLKNHENFGKLMAHNGMNHVSWWTDPTLPEGAEQYCNQINGSDGSIFAPFVDRQRVIRIFSPDMCRSFYLEYQSAVNYRGIPGFRYTMPDDIFEHPNKNEDNRCFCKDPQSELANNCLDGGLRIFPCKQDSPFVLSKPHFDGGDEFLRRGVEGLTPDAHRHATELVLEPTTGSLLLIRSRFQFNVEIQPLKSIDAFEGVNHTIAPVCWIETEALLDENGVSELRNRLVIPMRVLNVFQWVVLGSLVVLIAISTFLMIRKQKKEEPK